MTIQDEKEFLLLVGENSPSGTAITPKSSQYLTAAEVVGIIERLGYEALPADIFLKMTTDEQQKLGSVAFKIYEKVISPKLGTMKDLWFMPSPMVYSGIPINNPGSRTQHFSSSGLCDVTVSMPISRSKSDQVQLPFGMPGRQVLSLLSTLALQVGEDEMVSLPAIKTRFVEEVFDTPATGGARGTVKRYTESLISWLNATIHIVHRGEMRSEGSAPIPYTSVKPMALVEEARYWGVDGFSKKAGVQFTFSRYFTQLAKSHAVPIEREIQLQIAKLEDPLAFDIYHWAIYRSNAIKEGGAPIALNWQSFKEQFMPDHLSTKYSVAEAALESIRRLERAGFKLPIIAGKREGLMLLAGGAPTIRGYVTPQQKSLF